MTGGIHTGAQIGSHLATVFGDKFTPITVLIASKVRLNDVGKMHKSIGLYGYGDVTALSTVNSGINPEAPRGLWPGFFEQLGFGDTLGCPAAMRATPECIGFLKIILPQFGIPDPEIRKTMLEEFALLVDGICQTELRDWYDGLTQEQRRELIQSNDRHILEGHFLQWQAPRKKEGHGGNPENSCPYNPSRKE